MKDKKSIQQIKDNISPNDFDDLENLKPSMHIYLCFIYLCKALLITAMALASLAQQTNEIISTVYSVQNDYYFDIAVGLMTLIAIYFFSKRNSLAKAELKITTIYIVKFAIPSLLLLELSYLLFDVVQTKSILPVTVIRLSLTGYLFFTYVFSTREKIFRAQY